MTRAPIPSFAYIATPYSKFDSGIERAWIEACKVTAEFVRRGISVYSPIAHTHPVAIHGGIDPLDHELWMAMDKAMMEAASELYVIHMVGWKESKGITMEIAEFKRTQKPVTHFSWPALRALELADEVRG